MFLSILIIAGLKNPWVKANRTKARMIGNTQYIGITQIIHFAHNSNDLPTAHAFISSRHDGTMSTSTPIVVTLLQLTHLYLLFS